jgi:hypothetical protein
VISRMESCLKVAAFLLCIAAFVSIASCFRKPTLTSSEAAKLISGTPQFNESRTLVSVDDIDLGAPSMHNWALANFRFRERRSFDAEPVKAIAQMSFVKGRWQVDLFAYGKGSDRVAVAIRH